MKIQHNISAINSQRNISTTSGTMSKNLEKLSSGYKINRAGDNAAGLAISEGMRAQITSLNQAKRNTLDGISLVQTVEGALTEVHSMLNRMKGMAVQAANGTYEDSQRAMMNSEMEALKEEMGRIGTSTTFSGVPLFTNGGTKRDVTVTAFYGCTLDLNNQTVSVNYMGNTGRAATAASSGGYDILAETIATELIPNAASQILDAFPSLKADIGSDKIDLELRVEYVDGSSGMLAYASASFWANGRPFNMKITVDTGDFSDESLQSGSSMEAELKSTIAHELMHSVMQYTLTDGMFGRNGQSKYPEWFVEGTAQLAGGGFPTGWNNSLQSIAGQLADGNDSSKDGAIANYLKSYNVKDRPYGHGYLACAYIGWLANGKGAVDANSISGGMDGIFSELLQGKSLYSVLSAKTGGLVKDQASLESLFDNPSSDMVSFIRQLSFASKGGAGSVVATGGLSTGGSSMIGNSVGPDGAAFQVDKWSVGPTGKISLLVGGYDNFVDVNLFRLDSTGLRLTDTNIATLDDANKAIANIDSAIDRVSEMRSHYGAIQNRLEHTLANIDNTTENLTAAESQIRDTDMAAAITEHVRNQIILQSGQSMLAQANQIPQNILSLLGA